MATLRLRATSFATPQDIAAYRKCRDAGHSDAFCTSHPGGGDNGEGKWGDDTTSTTVAYCALGPSLQKKHQAVHVVLFTRKGKPLGNPFDCIQGDGGDEGIIDLNPGSLVAAGLPHDMELDARAEVTIGKAAARAKPAVKPAAKPASKNKPAAKKSAARKKAR
jgi:hypothetical protein